MLGFEIKFGNRVIHASTGNEGVLSIGIDYRNKSEATEYCGMHLSINGLVSFEYLNWFSGNIDNMEKITIKVVDVKQNSELAYSYPQDEAKLLQTYYSLKKELEEWNSL